MMAGSTKAQLTPRETRALELAALGLNHVRIGRLMGIARGTVSKHLSNAYAKLDAGGGTEAVLKAIRLGILECPPGWREPSGGG
jgi:DNA-binding CsgD family transcriptional regulator